MNEPPASPTVSEVAGAAAETWGATGAAAYLPVGFGAHHWRCGDLFLTLDAYGARHDAVSLEQAYAGAAALADGGLEFVLAPLPSAAGGFTVPLGAGALSATPWREGRSGVSGAPASVLTRLHATPPPKRIPAWRPLVAPSLGDDLAARAAEPWDGGPLGEEARALVREHLTHVARWADTYLRLAATSDPDTWVATHGEPHERNVLATAEGPLLVDWESLKLAPAERDLVHAGLADSALFDLEWRLDEVQQYAAWFSAEHAGDEDDRVALGGLRHELTREDHHSDRPPSPD